MGTALTAKQCVQVTLLRPNVGQHTLSCPQARHSRICFGRPAWR